MKWLPILLILLSCTSKQSPGKEASDTGKNSSFKPLHTDRDTTITKDSTYTDLSILNNYKLAYEEKYVHDSLINSTWKIMAYDKKTGYLVDSFRQKTNFYGSFSPDFRDIRSLITGKNEEKEAPNNEYGNVVIADLNFDLREDIAIINDLGGNGGPFYSFYLQDKNGKYLLDKFLTDSMIYFPTQIHPDDKTLVTYVHAGACGLGEHVYKFEEIKNQFIESSHRIINICKDQ